jgi:hypothetical protein
MAVAAVFEDPATARLHLLESSQVVVAFSPGAPRMSSPAAVVVSSPQGGGREGRPSFFSKFLIKSLCLHFFLQNFSKKSFQTVLIFCFKLFDKIFLPTFFFSLFL